jgi:hypothetical protein
MDRLVELVLRRHLAMTRFRELRNAVVPCAQAQGYEHERDLGVLE